MYINVLLFTVLQVFHFGLIALVLVITKRIRAQNVNHENLWYL